MPTTRPPAVAGLFYPDEPAALERMVDGFLAAARAEGTERESARPPASLLAPHAGYRYSGMTAARAYATIDPARVRRVVLLGPAHRVAVRGLALPGVDALGTPLGDVAVDTEAVAALAGAPLVLTSPEVHRLEHSLEVHLPFLQRALPGVPVVPLVVGGIAAGDIDHIAAAVESLWGGPETLVVASTDLSHFHSYEQARRRDAETLAAITRLEGPITPSMACGAWPVSAVLVVARRRDMTTAVIDARNSGDTTGDRESVVGYASVALWERP